MEVSRGVHIADGVWQGGLSGVAFSRDGKLDDTALDEALRIFNADAALYRAKRAGGDRVVVLATPAPDRAPTVGRGRSGVA